MPEGATVVNGSDAPSDLLVSRAPPLYEALSALARDGRVVFFAGLPGTGKSLLIHQLAHLGHARGRSIHLLQWDVARPVFEAAESGQRYPPDHGVAHGVIRMAVGRWARRAVARWDETYPGPEHLLVGETPFVGSRLIELARPADDRAEPVLTAESTRFVIPVPSRAVRRHLEAERERRAERPLHGREREDAPPHVVRDLWRQLVGVAHAMGIATSPPDPEGEPPYEPEVYGGVYQRILARRRAAVLPLDAVLPTAAFSVYDYAIPRANLTPSEDDIERFIGSVEATHPTAEAVQGEIEGWYVAP